MMKNLLSLILCLAFASLVVCAQEAAKTVTGKVVPSGVKVFINTMTDGYENE